MLVSAVRLDRGTPETLVALRDKWLGTDASEPLLIDLLACLPTGGHYALKRLRAALARSEDAAKLAGAYIAKAENRFHDEVARLTWRLAPDPRPAAEVLAELERTQGSPAAIKALENAWSSSWYYPQRILPADRADVVHAAIGMRQQILDRIGDASQPEKRGWVSEIIHATDIAKTLDGLYGLDRMAGYRNALRNELVRLDAAYSLVYRRPSLRWPFMGREKALAMIAFALSPLDPGWLKDRAWARRLSWPFWPLIE